MKFNVIIGNPPYQEDTGMSADKFNTVKTSSLYDRFIENAIRMKPDKLSMIIPSRWYNTSNSALNQMKNSLLYGDKIETLVDFPDARIIFPNVRIAGGVCYFNWESKHNDKCRVINGENEMYRYLHEPVMIRDNIAYSIIDKIKQTHNQVYMSDIISKNPFEIQASSQISDLEIPDGIRLKTSYGYGYTERSNITGNNILDKHKLIIGKLLAGGGDHPVDKNGQMKIISGIYRIKPGEAFGPSFLMIDALNSEIEILNLESYVKTRFVRFLIYSTLTGLNIGKVNFTYVPVQDYSVKWSDEALYTKYNLSNDEIEYINRIIKGID